MDKETYADLKYQNGFGNGFASEAIPGALPIGQNSPNKLKFGLFAEQLSGTAFTMKRAQNQKTWTYKCRPSVVEGQYKKSTYPYRMIKSYFNDQQLEYNPNQIRWRAIPKVKQGKVNFIQGMVALMGAGEPTLKQGISIYAYSANTSMSKTAFYNSDGDFLIVPQSGTLYLRTLNGKMIVEPWEILIMPRGIKFSVDVEGDVTGWIAELYGHHLTLPELGPIGANGLANPGDFQYPTAWFEDIKEEWTLLNKYLGEVYEAANEYSPYDVVAWRGNYAPCKYDLHNYNTIGSITFDHPDPSIFTVLTCRSHIEGTATLDFAIFNPRWLVQQHTFKPPYFHRNCMTEYMCNVSGQYDAKGADFGPGCSSLHSCMIPHGPDAESYEKSVKMEEKPYKTPENGLSFMFESGYLLKTTKWAMHDWAEVQKQYAQCWQPLKDIKYAAQ